jgi:hypothetical protein
MATTVASIADILGFEPIFPKPEDIDPERLVISYNDAADTLYVHFFKRGEPATSIDVDECLYLRVNRTSQRVVGLQIEGFLIRAVREHPDWLSLAELAGIPQHMIDEARASIDAGQRRRAVVLPILKELDLLAT